MQALMMVALVLLLGTIIYFFILLKGKKWSSVPLTIILEIAGKWQFLLMNKRWIEGDGVITTAILLNSLNILALNLECIKILDFFPSRWIVYANFSMYETKQYSLFILL